MLTGCGNGVSSHSPTTGGASATGAGGQSTAGVGGQSAAGVGGQSAAGVGGSAGNPTGTVLSPTGDCAMEVRGEDFCKAQSAFDARCDGVDQERVYEICLTADAPTLDLMDPCLAGVLVRSCFEDCDWTTCSAEAIAQTHPELVREDIFVPCIRDRLNPPPGIDCNQEWLEGRQLACIEKSRPCNAPQGLCISAAVVRAELLPQTDACIAGTCENLDTCLRTIFGL